MSTPRCSISVACASPKSISTAFPSHSRRIRLLVVRSHDSPLHATCRSSCLLQNIGFIHEWVSNFPCTSSITIVSGDITHDWCGDSSFSCGMDKACFGPCPGSAISALHPVAFRDTVFLCNAFVECNDLLCTLFLYTICGQNLNGCRGGGVICLMSPRDLI